MRVQQGVRRPTGALAAAILILLCAAGRLGADPVDDFRSLLDDKVAVRTSLGLRRAHSVADDSIEVVIGLSVTRMSAKPEAYRIVSFEDGNYAFEKFVRPLGATVRTEHEADAPPGCPFPQFERTIVSLQAPFPLVGGTEYHVVAIGAGSEMVTAAHSAQTFVHGEGAARADAAVDLAVLGLRRLKAAGPRHVEARFGPNFAPDAGDVVQSYTITVNGSPVTPRRIGRLSRVDTYLPVGWPFRAIPEHTIYFELPASLADGDVVELEASEAVTRAANRAALRFDTFRSHTDSIKVNQVGYLTDSPVKRAYLGRWMGSLGALPFEPQPQEFLVCEAGDGEVAWRGKPEFRHHAGRFDEGILKEDMSGENVYVLDFTEFRRPGRYFIAVPGVGRSFEFRISDDVYDEAFQVAAHGVFIQRCGIELGPPHSDWRRIACHKKGIEPTTLRKLGQEHGWKELPDFVDPQRPRVMAYGGHHDAGDYNPRSHIDIAQVLMDAYEMAPRKFCDGQLNIPESANGIPDVLDEAAWALQLWQMLQDEDGGVPHGTESNGDPNFIQTAELDPLGDYAYAKDAWGSFTFAGAMAQASRIWGSLGRTQEAADFLARGRRAYQWAMAHDHSDQASRDAWAYAAAEMLHTTREGTYNEHFRQACAWTENPDAPLDQYRTYDQSRAAWAYVNCPDALVDAELKDRVRRAILRQADEFIANARTMAYAFIKHPYAPFSWGTGAYENFLFPVVWAWRLTGEEEYLRWMVHTCDNTLGANPLNKSWIVGLGTRTIRAPLHNSRYGISGEVAPGIQAEGPYNRPEGYRVAETCFPEFDKQFPPLYNHVDCHFAIAMDEGVVRAQANTMAAFGLLLPDRP